MNIFFGAGGLGKRYYAAWRGSGITVDYFMDNDPALWYKRIEGVEVLPPKKLEDFPEDINILITCRSWMSILRQLLESGVQEHQIRICDSIEMLEAKELSSFWPPLDAPGVTELSPRDVLFTFDWGFRLGGAEGWGLDVAGELRKLGWNTCILFNRNVRSLLNVREDADKIKIVCAEAPSLREELSCITASMLQYRNIVCNFLGFNLMSAIRIKKKFPMYHVIVVTHTDQDEYYQGYVEAEPYIDKCLVVSNKIGAEMIKRGFPKEKLMYLPFKVPCNEVFSHCYSQCNEPLRIGYAGRVVVSQKRVDLLLTVAKKLVEQGVDFRMEIAGTGSYELELRRQIQTAGLQNKVCCLGMLPDISQFWFGQDVMITCSEMEGHSGTQCEAMAAGAVPVITDTSGAREDVEDGKNGFVVEIGDLDKMVERLCFLYTNRERLAEFGKRAHEAILKRNQSFDTQTLWEDILLK